MLLFIIFFLIVLFPFVFESDILCFVPYILNHRRREGWVTKIILFLTHFQKHQDAGAFITHSSLHIIPSFRTYIVIYISTMVKPRWSR